MAAPMVPGDLDSTGKALYRKLKAAMQEREGAVAWNDTDHYLLSEACRTEQELRTVRRQLAGEGSWTTEGDRKQLTVHPLARALDTLRRAWLEALKELGFSPRARAQLGIEGKRPAGGKFGGALGS